MHGEKLTIQLSIKPTIPAKIYLWVAELLIGLGVWVNTETVASTYTKMCKIEISKPS